MHNYEDLVGLARICVKQSRTAANPDTASELIRLVYFPAQNSTTLAFGENQPVGGKLQGRTELNLTLVAASDSFL